MCAEALTGMLSGTGSFTMLAYALCDHADLLERVADERPDVVLFDTHGCDRDVGALASAIRQAAPDCAVLAMVEGENDPALLPVLDAGALGVIHRGLGVEDLAAAVRTTAAHEAVLPPTLAKAALAHARAATAAEEAAAAGEQLSPRELQVLTCVAQGKTNEQIADSFGVSASTVKNQVYSACRKLGASSRSQAVAEAIRLGLVTPGTACATQRTSRPADS